MAQSFTPEHPSVTPEGVSASESAPRRRRAASPTRGGLSSRPDRFALWAVGLAVTALVASAATSKAASGGVTADGGDSTTREARYARVWDGYPARAKRWARRTSACESGHNPRAVGGNGRYRGAFQFTRPTWRSAPRTPGGDPVRYAWKTQAVVAVALKRRDGARNHWPSCG